MTRIDLARASDIPAGTGVILQIVTAISTTDDTTTVAASYQASSLSAAITPIADDSTLLVTVDGTCKVSRVAGTIATRVMLVRIQNTTDAATVVDGRRGSELVAADADPCEQQHAIGLRGIYTVNSLTTRTFQLQFASGNATNVQAEIRGASQAGGVLMTIMEIAA